jgi:hypothetical protein
MASYIVLRGHISKEEPLTGVTTINIINILFYAWEYQKQNDALLF